MKIKRQPNNVHVENGGQKQRVKTMTVRQTDQTDQTDEEDRRSGEADNQTSGQLCQTTRCVELLSGSAGERRDGIDSVQVLTTLLKWKEKTAVNDSVHIPVRTM